MKLKALADFFHPKKAPNSTHRGGDPPTSHAGNPEGAFTKLLARQAELEAELTVACTHHHRAVLLWEVGYTSVKAQVAVVAQSLGQPQELKSGHHILWVRREDKHPLEGDSKAGLTSFLETFSCRDLSCRCCSLVTRIHPRSISDTVYSEDRVGWGKEVPSQ